MLNFSINSPSACVKFRTSLFRKKRYLGRFLAFWHLLLHHSQQSPNHLLQCLSLLITGKTWTLNYLYKNYLLIKMPDSVTEGILNDVFGSDYYNWNFPRNNPVIVDIGSNVGLSILYFKQKYPESKIYAYEANPKLMNYLMENLTHNLDSTKGIHVNNQAVVAKNDFNYLFFNSSNHSAGSLYKEFAFQFTGKDSNNKVKINLLKFTDIMNKLKKIDILKVDAEGIEFDLLPLILKYSENIHSIVLETHGFKKRDSFDLVTKLSSKYRLGIHNHTPAHLINKVLFNPSSMDTNCFMVYGVSKSFLRAINNRSLVK